MYTCSPVSFSWHSMKEALSLLTCSDIVSSESCLQPYTLVTAVLSVVATCMVSWKHSVEHMDTQYSLSVVFVSDRQSVIWMMGPHTFTCSICDCHWCLQSGANVPSKISLPSPSTSSSPSSYTPPPPTHVCRPVPLLTVDIMFCTLGMIYSELTI